MDIAKHNRDAWTKEVESGNVWTRPVDADSIRNARNNEWAVVLTPTVPVPRDWFGDVRGKRVLCLASGGGQQGPILSAAGAAVTVFDNCPAQLEKDRLVAERENLQIRLEQGDMRDLSRFGDGSFDLIFHPVSNCFVDDVESVWKEAFRVLGKGGRLLSGFCNPLIYIFDMRSWDRENRLEVKYSIPYSDLEQLSKDEIDELMRERDTLEFGHSLETQIGGQIKAGFSVNGFYEDTAGGDLLDQYIKTYIATLAIKPL